MMNENWFDSSDELNSFDDRLGLDPKYVYVIVLTDFGRSTRIYGTSNFN